MSIVRLVARAFLWIGLCLAALAALGAALFFYFVYTPAPAQPRLSGSLRRAALEIDGVRRSYSVYLPASFAPGAPVILALHGSDGSAARLRMETGYAFERLADRHGFALVYPNGFEGNWNACNVVGDYRANTLNIDDVAFLTTLVSRLVGDIHIDSDRVYAVGVSRGGHMAFRLAFEAPARFRAVAAVAANLPAPSNFKCKPAPDAGTSVMIMNGLRDPLNPFEGGEVRIFGLYSRGAVVSAQESARFFANLNGIGAPPSADREGEVLHTVWRNDATEIELVAIGDGGHSLPQPYRRAPRILGPTATHFDGADEIWRFFERQQPRPGN